MILIKGMEMPTRCFSCPMCEVENAEVNCAISHGSYIEYREVDPDVALQEKPSWCPIVEIPPHGRLIDADKLGLTDFEIVMCDGNYKKGLEMLAKKIEDASTVIPADKDGET